MMTKFGAGMHKKHYSCSTALAGIAMAAMMFTPAAAWAQDEEEQEEEAIIVTGTRIQQPDFEFSNPVVSLDAQAIQQSGATNLTEFAQDMPALLNSFDSEESADTGNGGGLQGQNLLDLRGLGYARTLVLVDGRRHVAGVEGTSAVDINTIPIDLVERVEVLTGGASAVYGADGVTGVVNFVMRDDFDGLIVRGQRGWLDQGGGGDEFLSALWGTNFAGGRGNFTIAGEWSSSAALDFNERDYIASGNAEFLADDPLYGTPGHPYQNIPTRNMVYIDTSRGGSFTTDFDGLYWSGLDDDPGSLTGMDFIGTGAPWVDGAYVGGAFMQGGSGSPAEDFNDQLVPDLDRYTINLRAHYDLNNQHRLIGEFKWGRTETYFVGQPTYEFFTFMSSDNPYMPASIRNAGIASGMDAYYGGVFMFRDNFDLGTLDHEVERNTFRAVGALQGAITDSVDYEVSVVWGQTTSDQRYRTRNNERWFAAIDVVDNGAGPECRDNSGGETWDAGTCVPLNVFGEGNMSQAAIDWVMTDLNNQETISQFVLSGFVSGTASPWGFELPGGPISFALGAEYREEESEYDYDDSISGLSDPATLFWNGQGADSRGRYDVAEAYAEVELPLLRDAFLAEDLTLDAAFRLSEYSSIGGTEAWKVGLRYRPIESLMFRGTIATAVRAPNISELYLPQQVTFGAVGDANDPCDADAVDTGSALREANCIAAFAALGVPYDPNTWNNSTSTTIPGIGGGNENLRPESADTTTYGFVFEPRFLPGLSISVDYWEIELQDAIQLLSVGQIAAYCYDFAQPNEYCNFVTRTATGVPSFAIPAGGIDGFTTTYLNVASFDTAGYDIGVRYRLDPADWGVDANIGTFQFGLNATHLTTWEFRDSELSPPILFVGTPGTPDWQTVFDATWLIGDFTVNYGYSWFSETDRFSDAAIAADPDIAAPEYLNWSARSVHDIYVAYDFDNRFRVYGGINNFLEQTPDRASTRNPYPVNELGRAFYVGARAVF